MSTTQIQLHPLLVLSMQGEGRMFRLDQDTHAIGRSQQAAIRLCHPHVSRRQTLLIRQPDGSYLLCDGDGHTRPSTNGTFVNGIAVERRYLRHGDVIAFGGPEIVAQFFQSETPHAIEE